MATLEEIIYEVGELSVRSQRTELDLVRFMNRAIRMIAQRKDFTAMHDRRPFYILTGNTSVSLGADFKKMSDEESPVSVSYVSGGNTYNLPVLVISREQVERQQFWPLIAQFQYQPSPGGFVPIRVVFLERNAGGDWALFIPPQFSVQNTTQYNVSAFFYPAPLKLGTDHNAITDDPDLVQAIIDKTRSITYLSEDPNSVPGKAALALYEEAFKSADYADSAIKYQARDMHM